MSPGAHLDSLCRGRAVELVGTDREAGLEVLDAEVARDVEQHRPTDDALLREMVHAESAGAAGRGHETGPVTVVERRVAADVTETVELGRCLQRHDDVVVRNGIPRAAPTAAEHAVAGGHAVEVQRLRSVPARSRRTDRQRERKSFSGLHERGGGRDAFGCEVVGGADLVERRRTGPSCCAAPARRRRPCRPCRRGTPVGPNRETDRRGYLARTGRKGTGSPGRTSTEGANAWVRTFRPRTQ